MNKKTQNEKKNLTITRTVERRIERSKRNIETDKKRYTKIEW